MITYWIDKMPTISQPSLAPAPASLGGPSGNGFHAAYVFQSGTE